MQWLISIGADVNQEQKQGETALQRAIYRNDLTIIHDLCTAGANLECQTYPAKINACLYAMLRKKPAILDLLLTNGASLDYYINRATIKLDPQHPNRFKTNQRTINEIIDNFAGGEAIHAKHLRWR